MFTAHVIERT